MYETKLIWIPLAINNDVCSVYKRNAILMLQQQGLSYEEIAQALDASVSAIKTWIHRARKHLRQELKDFA